MQNLFNRYVNPLNVKSLQSAILVCSAVNLLTCGLNLWQMALHGQSLTPTALHYCHMVLAAAYLLPLLYQRTRYMKVSVLSYSARGVFLLGIYSYFSYILLLLLFFLFGGVLSSHPGT